jgi:hypothetical protein
VNSNRAVLVAAVLVLGGAGPARADVVLDWNGLAARLIVGPGGASKVPPLGLVDLAIVHTAIYDAVNAVEGFPFSPYGIEPTITTPASAEAAAARAGRDVLLALYPPRSADIEMLYASSLARSPTAPQRTTASTQDSRPPRASWRSGPTTVATRERPSSSRLRRPGSGSEPLQAFWRRKLRGQGPSFHGP